MLKKIIMGITLISSGNALQAANKLAHAFKRTRFIPTLLSQYHLPKTVTRQFMTGAIMPKSNIAPSLPIKKITTYAPKQLRNRTAAIETPIIPTIPTLTAKETASRWDIFITKLKYTALKSSIVASALGAAWWYFTKDNSPITSLADIKHLKDLNNLTPTKIDTLFAQITPQERSNWAWLMLNKVLYSNTLHEVPSSVIAFCISFLDKKDQELFHIKAVSEIVRYNKITEYNYAQIDYLFNKLSQEKQNDICRLELHKMIQANTIQQLTYFQLSTLMQKLIVTKGGWASSQTDNRSEIADAILKHYGTIQNNLHELSDRHIEFLMNLVASDNQSSLAHNIIVSAYDHNTLSKFNNDQLYILKAKMSLDERYALEEKLQKRTIKKAKKAAADATKAHVDNTDESL